MTKIAKVLAVSLLLAVIPAARSHAQTNTVTYRTNVLINLSFSLTAYEQVYVYLSTNGIFGPLAPIAQAAKVATSGIIKSIHDRAHLTDNVENAKLYWRISWTDPTNDLSKDVILRNPAGIMGTNDMVVNNYISVSFPDSVTTLRATLAGTTNATDYANCSATLSTSQGSFSLHGIATLKSASLFNGKSLIDPNPYPTTFTATVSGSGSLGFHRAEWKGTIMGSGQKLEITPVSP
jgi:hypothetical protein